MSRKQKGFTLVEMVIVMAIIGILAGIFIPIYSGIIERSDRKEDIQLVNNLNDALSIEVKTRSVNSEFKFATAFDAVKVCAEKGYLVNTIVAKSSLDIAYDFNGCKFVLIDTENGIVENISGEDITEISSLGNEANYYIFRSSLPVSENEKKYSIFANDGWDPSEDTVNLNGNCFDAGYRTEIITVNYTNTNGEAKDVVIRTNGGVINIDAPTDTVRHYGFAESVKITRISQTSYYEYGEVFFVDIASGRLVISNDENAKISAIYLTATGDVYEVDGIGIILAYMSGANLPDIIERAAVTAPTNFENRKLIAEIEQVDENGIPDISTIEKMYLCGSGISYEESKGYLNVSDLAELLLEAVGKSGTIDVTVKSGNTTKKVSVDTTQLSDAVKQKKEIDAAAAKVQALLVNGDSKTYTITCKEDLIILATIVNSGNDLAGYTAIVSEDIDLSGMTWTPIGTSANPFAGVFDGRGHKISNMTVKVGSYSGLFGYVCGTPNEQYKVITDIWVDNELNETNVSESNYSCVIKNIVLENSTVNAGTYQWQAGTLVGEVDYAYIANITVNNTVVTGQADIGGVAGSAHGTCIKNCVVDAESTISATRYYAGGIVGASNIVGSDFTIAILDCTNYAKVTTDYKSGGTAAGILGCGQNGHVKAIVINNCVNYGTIESANHYVAGVAGTVHERDMSVVANCVNYGEIVALEGAKYISGIVGQSGYIIYNCTNYGTLSGETLNGSAAILAVGDGPTIIDCYNKKKILEIDEYTLLGYTWNGTTVSGKYENVAQLQEALTGINGTVIFQNCTVDDMSGILVWPSTINGIISDKQYFAGLDISQAVGASGYYITLDIPDFVYELHGDASTKTLGVSGKNNVVTFASDCKLSWLRNYGSNGKYIKESGCEVVTIHGAKAK